MKKYFHTIRARILLHTISLILLISIIISFVSFFFASSNLRNNLIQTTETKLSLLASSIDSNIESVRGFVHSCQTSSQVRKFTMEEDNTDRQRKREAHDFVINTYNSNTALRSQLIRLVIIRNSENDMIQVVESSYSSIAVSADAIMSLPCFETLYDHPGKLAAGILQDPFSSSKDVPVLPYIVTIEHPYKPEEIGCIFTEISTSVITDPLYHYTVGADSRLYFHIGDQTYQYIEQELTACDKAFDIVEDLSDIALSHDTTIQKAKDSEGKNCILITRPLDNDGLYVRECLDEQILSRNVFQTFFIVIIIILASATIIGVLFFWFLSKTVNVPVKQLQERMKRIAAGDFSRDPSTEWDHELGDIGKNINDLSENVLSLMNQRIEDERQKKDYEYRMLQSQINPHFLYNTLNSIKWMATIQNASGIAEMTISLSRLLKDISKGTTSLVPISHEISLIKDYFTIQQYRYGGTITLDLDIDDPSLTESLILKFTLQPIVENAIFHGIEPKGTAGTISIHIYQGTASNVCIDITDDGVGMDEETLAHLFDDNDSSADSSFFREIGLNNVHKRLQYEFGSSYGLHATSKPGEFTTISILLPFVKEEVTHV